MTKLGTLAFSILVLIPVAVLAHQSSQSRPTTQSSQEVKTLEIAGGVAHGAELADAAARAAIVAKATSRLKQLYAPIKEALAAVKGNVAELVGGAENLKKIQDAAKWAAKSTQSART